MIAERERLAEAVRAVEVLPPYDYRWLAREGPSIPRNLQPVIAAVDARAQLRATLQLQLYRSFYCPGTVVAEPPEVFGSREPTSFLEQLAAANAGAGRWEPGWTVRGRDGDALLAARDGLTVRADVGEWRANGDGAALRLPKDSYGRSPGFYVAYADAPFEPETEPLVLRLYWNVRADGAARLVRCTTSLLNTERVPFLLKVVNHPDRYLRCDGAVLYLPAVEWERAAPLLARLQAALAPVVRLVVAPFTERLADGLSVAESPPGGESFGMHRCGLLADGLIRSAEIGATTLDARLAVVAEQFAAAGIDLARPHLNPGSSATYALPVVPARRPPSVAGRAQFQAAADAIGARLADDALWHEDRCTWIGGDPGQPSASTLGPSVYDGTAGVAWFLAELWAARGDERVRATAVGAARHALRHADLIGELGLYAGALGVALAASRVGLLLDEPGLVDAARSLALSCVAERPAERERDLIAGDAGAIAALLALERITGAAELGQAANDIAAELVAAGADGAWSSAAGPPLTGFSHGSAGIAWALRLTGEWGAAADEAFAFERRWFDAEASNWRDLRPPPMGGGSMVAWCHGAPGIALARLDTAEAELRAEARIALATTRTEIERILRHGVDDFSLCHGLTGLAEVLLLAGGDARLARRVGQHGLAAFHEPRRPWACGTRGGEAPGLLLGTAGIGAFYLRLAGATLPSPLLPDPAALAAAPPRRARSRSPRASRLTDENVAELVRTELRAAGFSLPRGALGTANERRWETGLGLRDRGLLRSWPSFADELDYLDLADAAPHLWNSLPFMLAFGREQALVLAPLAGVPSARRPEAAEVCAIFSALLSVFDHAVDERHSAADVFAFERDAVAGLFRDAPDQTLPEAYAATADPAVKFVCVLFALLGDGLHALATPSSEAWTRLERTTVELFAAERACTLQPAATPAELHEQAAASHRKSVLPFVTLLRILATVAGTPESERALAHATALGRLICLADDTIDVLVDLRRRAPSPLVVSLLERGDPDDDVIATAVRAAAGELADGLRAFAADADPAVLAFAQRSVARWVGWEQ